MRGWFNSQKPINVIHYINRIKNKNIIITLIDAEKAFDKVQHHFMKKGSITGKELPNLIKVIYGRPTANNSTLRLIPIIRQLDAFPLRSETRQERPLLQLLFNTVLEILVRGKWVRKRNELHPYW